MSYSRLAACGLFASLLLCSCKGGNRNLTTDTASTLLQSALQQTLLDKGFSPDTRITVTKVDIATDDKNASGDFTFTNGSQALKIGERAVLTCKYYTGKAAFRRADDGNWMALGMHDITSSDNLCLSSIDFSTGK
jgi:hypothetical protein